MAGMTTAADLVAQARRLVVKTGSSLLIDGRGRLRSSWLAGLAEDLACARKRGQEVLIVSSGAIALGRKALELSGPLKLEESQAAAAAGQIHLAHAWRAALAREAIPVAQILLTPGDTEERRRYLNARSTLRTLLGLGVVPVINENDTVATAEIRYGDNDRLAARVASMVGAECLVLLSTVDGFYRRDPALGDPGGLIERVDEITPELEGWAGDAGTGLNRGGMKTKLAAARIARQGGCHMLIAPGVGRRPLRAVEAGGRCSWFRAALSPQAARKSWIGGHVALRGQIYIDAGAAGALARGKSLLPAGVAWTEGAFERGDAVGVRDDSGRELARGLVAYSSADAARIAGRKSDEIEAILGYRGRDEMIHRDDLVLTGVEPVR